jgi:hypothetical protein
VTIGETPLHYLDIQMSGLSPNRAKDVSKRSRKVSFGLGGILIDIIIITSS